MASEKTKINQLKAGAALSYISIGIGYIILIVYTPIMLRLLGQSEYGLYNLVASVIAYLGILNFGFGSAYMRYYSRYKVYNSDKDIAKLNGMFTVIFSGIGIIAMLFGLIFVFNTNLIFGGKLTANELEKSKYLIALMVLNIAISFPISVFNSHIMANEKFVFQKLLQMIKLIANPFIMLPVLLMGYKSVGMVVVTIILNIGVGIASIVFCIKKLRMKFVFYDFNFSLMKEMTVFSSFIFMNIIIDQINWNVDKLILGKFRGTISVAIYGLAAQLNTYYISLSTAISTVFIPRINRIVASTGDNSKLTSLFTKVGRVQFMVLSLISSGLIFFGQPFINMWVGVDYSKSYPILLILILSVTIPSIQNLGIEIQKAKNMHQFRSKIYFFIAIVNVLISIPLAKTYGGVGSAIGTAISLLLGNGLIMNWYYHNKIGLDMIYFWKQILKFIPALLLPVAIGILLSIFIDLSNTIIFLISGVIYVVAFSASMWFFGMNQYEKDLIRNPFARILIKARKRFKV